MKQPSYVTVCGTLIEKLFVLLVLCFKKGGWEMGRELATSGCICLPILFSIILGRVCPLSILPTFESEERKASLPYV